MNIHYLDLDDILTTGEMVQCVFETNVKNMGYINPSTDDHDLRKGTRLDLPFWMAHKLKNDELKVVSVDLPKHYRKSYRDIYKVDSDSIDLQGLGPHFYSLALKMPLLDRFQAQEITTNLLKIYQARFQNIMDSAQHATYKEGFGCTAKFDTMEKALFQIGQTSLNEMNTWKLRDSERIMSSALVQRHNKRKRPAEDDV